MTLITLGNNKSDLSDRCDRSYHGPMKTVTTTEAKAKLNSLLIEVDAGETITITSHGRPIAVLSKATPPPRKLDQFAGVMTVPEDFNEPMSDEDLALWGEGA
jgi:prevent-host-death family protein